MRLALVLMLWCLVLGTVFGAVAADDIRKFDNPEQQALFLELADQLRCPKCQNQNIADSNASVAKDLRAKVYKLVMEGKSKSEVVDFMVERYGYFVYYKPPLNAATLILWLLPLLFVLFTLLVIWRKSATSQASLGDSQWSEAQEQQLNKLINTVEQGKGEIG